MTNLEAVQAWQARQVSRGECRQCGNRLAKGSRSRCLICLERARGNARQRRGTVTTETRHRGRPLIGTLRERHRALREDETWRQRRQVRRQLSPPRPGPTPVRQTRFIRLPGGDYQIVWDDT